MGGAVLVMQDQCFSDFMVGILRRLSSMVKPRARGVRWGCSDQATVSIKGDGWVFGVCIGEGGGGRKTFHSRAGRSAKRDLTALERNMSFCYGAFSLCFGYLKYPTPFRLRGERKREGEKERGREMSALEMVAVPHTAVVCVAPRACLRRLVACVGGVNTRVPRVEVNRNPHSTPIPPLANRVLPQIMVHSSRSVWFERAENSRVSKIIAKDTVAPAAEGKKGIAEHAGIGECGHTHTYTRYVYPRRAG